MRKTFGALVLLLVLHARVPLARAQLAVLGNTLQERVVAPGETYSGTILVVNSGRESATAKLYQTDYLFFADGTSRFDDPGTVRRSNARWVSLGTTLVNVPPGETVPIPFSVQVPAGDSLSGSYWSVVMVEALPDRPAPRARVGSVGLIPVVRYGIQIVDHVGGSGARRAEFADPRVSAGEAGAELAFQILNPGERAYHVDVRVQLFDEQGAIAGSYRKERGILYPGSSLLERVPIPALPPGRYQAVVLADTGEDQVFGAEYTIRK